MKKEWVIDKIEVECYAGYKGEESPRAFTHLGKRYEVEEILDRWYEESPSAQGPRHEYFKVRTAGGTASGSSNETPHETKEGIIFLLRHTPASQSWALFRHVLVPRFSNN
jgi:hypothetical protein